MITYITNYLLCSVMMYLPYRLWIERTSLHQFKRLYLLLVLILPLLIPAIEYNWYTTSGYPPPHVAIPNVQYVEHQIHPELNTTAVPSPKSASSNTFSPLLPLLWSIFTLITPFFTIRFIWNLWSIKKMITNGIRLQQNNYNIILTNSKHSPYTFWKYIFINQKEYNQPIHPAILKHEEAHVQQKHSLDIIISEIIIAFTWFNPINFFIRKEIVNNHEHLADQAVLQHKEYVEEYCYLLLNLPIEKNLPSITSQLNYKQVKNRLIMMTKKTSKAQGVIIFALTFSVMATAAILFSHKNVIASEQEKQTIKASDKLAIADSTKNIGAPKKLLAEYDSVINAITTIKKNPDGTSYTSSNLSKVDVNRMYYIASLMSEKQLEERTKSHNRSPITEWKPFVTAPQKRTPTKAEFDNWQNNKVYGVWIDGKKSNNSDLKKIKLEDIAHYYISKLHGKAKVGRSYTHQLDVYTEAGYDKSWGHLENKTEKAPNIRKAP